MDSIYSEVSKALRFSEIKRKDLQTMLYVWWYLPQFRDESYPFARFYSLPATTAVCVSEYSCH